MRIGIAVLVASRLILSAAPLAAQSDARPVVVELYTSQGCSSCPPADVMLGEMSKLPGIIPLALHVDYWDYIGWADSFAQPAFTARQQAYAIAAGERTVYTPQLIVGGLDSVVGADAMAVMGKVRQHAALETGVSVTLRLVGGAALISAEAATVPDRPLMVQLVRFRPQETVEIGAGENAGRSVTYHNIVTDWQLIGTWDGTAPFAQQVEIAGSEPVVVILQEQGPGLILAAAEARP